MSEAASWLSVPRFFSLACSSIDRPCPRHRASMATLVCHVRAGSPTCCSGDVSRPLAYGRTAVRYGSSGPGLFPEMSVGAASDPVSSWRCALVLRRMSETIPPSPAHQPSLCETCVLDRRLFTGWLMPALSGRALVFGAFFRSRGENLKAASAAANGRKKSGAPLHHRVWPRWPLSLRHPRAVGRRHRDVDRSLDRRGHLLDCFCASSSIASSILRRLYPMLVETAALVGRHPPDHRHGRRAWLGAYAFRLLLRASLRRRWR